MNRKMRNYTYSWGYFLFFRWFAASWLLHGVHVLDKTEKYLYVFFEVLLIVVVFGIMYALGCQTWWAYLIALIMVHTITWLTDSHWLVGFREVDKKFSSKGIILTLEYIEMVSHVFSKLSNIEAVLVYGSMSRRMFHNRSDLDIRIWQDGFSLKTFFMVQKYRFIGIWKYRIPLDLKLVDSMEYLKREMRSDEKAIVGYSKDGKPVYNSGFTLSDIKANPSEFLRENNPVWIAENKK